MESSDEDDRRPPNNLLLINDAYVGLETGYRYRLLRSIGTCFYGRIPVYKAAIVHSVSAFYDNITIVDVFLAVKCVHTDLYAHEAERLRLRAVQSRAVLGHENIVQIRPPFMHVGHYCVAFPHMDMGSVRHILRTKFPDGMPEECVLVILKETLKAVEWIHRCGSSHEEINASNVLINRKPEIKLAYQASVYARKEDWESPLATSNFLLIHDANYWGAPPESYHRYRGPIPPTADIWMIGIMAVELACGGIWVQSRESVERLVKKIAGSRKLPSDKDIEKLNQGKGKKKKPPPIHTVVKSNFSKGFHEMVAQCLTWHSMARPSAIQILEANVFKNLQMTVPEFYDVVCAAPVRL